MAVELPQMANDVEIVGVLKEKDLTKVEMNTTLKDKTVVQQNVIRGSVVIEFTDNNGNINNVRSQVFVGDTKRDGGFNKMYKTYETIFKDFVASQDKDENGNPVSNENPDVVRLTGQIGSNDYISSQGTQVSNNRITTRFINRLKDADKNTDGHAWATIEGYIDGFTDEIDPESQEPTGRKKATVFTIGYGGRVNELQNVFVPESLVEGFEQVYYPGSTGEITLSIKHFATVEKVQEDNSQLGFGEVKEVKAISNYTDELWLTGGKLPFEEPKALDEEQIALLKRTRKEHLASLDSNIPSAKPQVGFGAPSKQENKTKDSNPFAATSDKTDASMVF